MENVENFIKSIPGMGQYFGGESRQKLLFVPDAKIPDKDYEISDPALFRFLLNEETMEQCKEVQAVLPEMLTVLKDIDKGSKITEFETHQSSMGLRTDLKRAFHVFIVFQTTSQTADDGVYWWSLEKNRDYIVLQRSRHKDDVRDKCYGETRNKVKPIVEKLVGKGTINDLFAMLWANQMIPEEYHIRKSNCQSLVTFVSKRITEEEYEYKGYFEYFPPENDRNVKMLDLLKILTIESHPLLSLIHYENTDLLDKVIKSGNYVVEAIHSGITLLHFAIAMSKTKVVEYLLEKLNADPTIRREYGGNALQMAAMFTTKTEIIDLILARDTVKLDDVDGNGQSALHAAADSCNVVAAKHLIEKGANPNLFDKEGLSPLHMVARNRNGNPMIDLLLEAQKVKHGMGGVDDPNEKGMTALHYAAFSSNEITAEHLITKGADPNYQDKGGNTPLHYAALGARDMKIIDLLLLNIKDEEIALYKNNPILFFSAKTNKHGLQAKIVARLAAKGIAAEEKPENSSTNFYKVYEELDEATGAVTRRFAKEDAADPSTINFAQVYGRWIAGAKTLQELEEILKERNYNINDRDQNGETALHFTCKAANVEIARHLLENGADPTIRDNDGLTPLHIAAAYISDSDIFDLLLMANRNVDIDASDESGMTALHFATAASNVTGTRFLLSNGANPNTRNQNGSTPLHFAAIFAKDLDIVELLLNHPDVDVNCLDNSGLNALMHCARFNENGHGETIANLLTEKCAAAERDILNGSLIGDGERDREDVQHFYLSHRERMGSGEKEGDSVDYVDFFNDDKVKIEDKIEKMFLIRLDNAIANSDVGKVRHLLEMGAAELSKVTWGGGRNALHAVSKYATKAELLHVILETGIFDIDSRDENGHTALRFAVDANSVENVRHLLEEGADPTISDNDGFTPFHRAAQNCKDSDTLTLLLATENTIEIDEKNKSGLTALHMATYASNVTAARFLLSKGANPNVADKNGATPLHLAAIFAKDMQVVELLVNHADVDVNRLDNWGRNALDHARKNTNGQSERILELLKERGAVETEVENNPENIAKAAVALRDAITDSEVETIRNLLTHGFDISAVIWGEEGMNALHLASRYAKTTDVIDAILETGKFDINGGDSDGKTPLHYAIEGSDRAIIVPHLIQKGADPNIGEKRGITPVHLAAALNTDLDILDRLVSAYENVNINQSDGNGLTALHSAALASNVTAAHLLLDKGANPNATLQNGVTPLHMAAKSAKDLDIVELLLNHPDVDVSYLDNSGRKALDYATVNEHGLGEAIATLLKEKGVVEAGIKNKSENIVAMVINAIRDSDVETTRNLIDNGYDISTATWEEGMNTLHAASYYAETTDLIDAVLETGKFDINGGDNSGRTPLHYAINGTSHAIIAWVQRRTDPNIFYTTNGRTSIHTPVDTTDMDFIREVNANRMVIVGYLIGKGADPTIRDNDGITPLHVAATAGITNTDILDSLLAKGKLDVNDSSKSGLTALHMAVAESNLIVARFLLSKGANPNAVEENGLTPLHVAANFAKDLDIVKLLLNHNDVNVNYLNNRGCNALHCARNNFHGLGEAIANLLREKMAAKAEGSNHKPKNIAALVPGHIKEDSDMETIRFLIENGQDISAMTWGKNGANALHLAAANAKTTDLIDTILETGKFDINGVDSDGRTPLHYAIKRPDPVTINARRLIKMGADPSIADKNGVTPLHMAARNAESMDLIEILLNTEAVDVNYVDKQGGTALSCARSNKHGLGQRIIARLRKSGANE